jgi:hypothetical protein
MERLFDPDSRPYFLAWLRLYDLNYYPPPSAFSEFVFVPISATTPLYYASLCGFQDLVEYLVAKYPHQVKIDGGYYRTPALAALAGKHFKLVRLLHLHASWLIH